MAPPERLVPILRTPFVLDDPERPLVRATVLPLIRAYVGVVEEAGVRLVEAAEATRLGMSFQELIARAVADLATAPVRVELHDVADGVHRVVAADGLAASRVLIPGWLDDQDDVAGARPVCAMPTPDELFLARGEAPADLVALAKAALERFHDAEEPLSPVLYAADAEGLVAPLELDEEHPAHGLLARAHASFSAKVYEDQAIVLEAALREREVEALVGDCRVLDLPDGGVATVATFVEGIEGLVPRTDLVMLAWQDGDEARFILVTREDLEAVCPRALVALPDYEPPRFVTLEFPSPDALGALRERALAAGARGGDEQEAS